MNNHDDAVRACRSYEIAFQVGLVGSIILALVALLGDMLAGLTALSVWCAIMLFVLPWLYIWCCDKVPHIPVYLLRGPHH